jgi:hypothetical protein
MLFLGLALIERGLVVSAAGGVIVTVGEVDAMAQGLSGRAGSSSGSVVDDPDLVSGTSGRLELHPGIAAGPVPPGGSPSTPGTTGVVTATADSVLEFVPTGTELAIDLLTHCESSIMHMDGGTYQATASAGIQLRFTVDTPTPFRLTGALAFDDESATSVAHFSGGNLGNILIRSGLAGNGPVNVEGVLGPGQYQLTLKASIYEVPPGGASMFEESGSGELRLVLNPNANFSVGDMNCDGVLSVGDLAPFVMALTTPEVYPTAYPACDLDLADMNHDGVVSVGDVSGFVDLLTGA